LNYFHWIWIRLRPAVRRCEVAAVDDDECEKEERLYWYWISDHLPQEVS
jgi:hypothetical protein